MPILSRRHVRIAGLVAALWLLLIEEASPALPQGSIEYDIKATFLYKFVAFVTWPDDAFESPSSPVRICVVGDDPFHEILDRAVAGQRIGERTIEVARMPVASAATECHVMYVAGSATQTVGQVLNETRGRPTLTFTNSSRNAPAKGIVHFVVRENRLRFEIDEQQAAENRLSVSSKVLSLAVSVRPKT